MKGISEPLMRLLKQLMQDTMLQDFYLAGGTGLALHLGHRESIDIDLFHNSDFDSRLVCSHLEQKYQAEDLIHELNTARVSINGIKVEFLTHSYPLIEDLSLIDGIRVASLKDLAAFKLNAVAGRGSKKDFWDVATLLDHYSMKQMLDYFSQKYPVADLWHLIKSLTYFDDAEAEQIEILDLKGKSWELIKNHILTAVKKIPPINE